VVDEIIARNPDKVAPRASRRIGWFVGRDEGVAGKANPERGKRIA
jgi:hypothetical protein